MSVKLSALLRQRQQALKLTKMICTIGPASSNPEVLGHLLQSGMSVARLNFSHGTHQMHFEMLEAIRAASKTLPHTPEPGIMLDTKGPEIRTGDLTNPKEPVALKKGSKVRLTTDYSVKSTPDVIAFSYPELYTALEVGSKMLLADGNLSLKIVEKDASSKTLIAEVQNDFKLGSKKNVNLPGVKINLPVVAEKDREDLIDFGLKHKVDYIALSFTTTAESVKVCKDVLGEAGKSIKIICKIENQEGVLNADKILEVSDGIMIARGDLGMEMDLHKMFVAQTQLCEIARRKRKVCVMATQMLESMVYNSRPTRAEITDVANASRFLVDSTMLSGETGGGHYAPESAETMNQITLEHEAHIDFLGEFLRRQQFDFDNHVGWYGPDNKLKGQALKEHKSLKSLALAAVQQAFDLEANGILVAGDNEELVKLISSLRPGCPIFYFSEDPAVMRGLNLCFGVYPLKDLGGAKRGPERRKMEALSLLASHKVQFKKDKAFVSVDGNHLTIQTIY